MEPSREFLKKEISDEEIERLINSMVETMLKPDICATEAILFANRTMQIMSCVGILIRLLMPSNDSTDHGLISKIVSFTENLSLCMHGVDLMVGRIEHHCEFQIKMKTDATTTPSSSSLADDRGGDGNIYQNCLSKIMTNTKHAMISKSIQTLILIRKVLTTDKDISGIVMGKEWTSKNVNNVENFHSRRRDSFEDQFKHHQASWMI